MVSSEESSKTLVVDEKSVQRPTIKPKKPNRQDLDQTFAQLSSLIHAASRPLPNKYGDGRDRKAAADEEHTGILTDLRSLKKQGFLSESVKTIKDLLRGRMKGLPVDDKTMIVGVPKTL
jgi:hypothetical protein